MGGVFSFISSSVKKTFWFFLFVTLTYAPFWALFSLFGVDAAIEKKYGTLIIIPGTILGALWSLAPVYFDIAMHKLFKFIPRYSTNQWLVKAQKERAVGAPKELELVFFESEERARSSWISCMHGTHFPLSDYKMVISYKDNSNVYQVRNAWAEQGSIHLSSCASLNSEGVSSAIHKGHEAHTRTTIGPSALNAETLIKKVGNGAEFVSLDVFLHNAKKDQIDLYEKTHAFLKEKNFYNTPDKNLVALEFFIGMSDKKDVKYGVLVSNYF